VQIFYYQKGDKMEKIAAKVGEEAKYENSDS
jgi:hypothetical protein